MKKINVRTNELDSECTRALGLKSIIEAKQAELDEIKAKFRAMASNEVSDDEKTVCYQGSEANVKVSFPNSSFKVKDALVLKSVLGEDFDKVIEVAFKVKDVEKLRGILKSNLSFGSRLASAVEEVAATARVSIE